ncbi:MAG: hypothetical protein OXR62_09725 [Ahrensia sp.]|nr:hypothetical protein [Ahrensia sp.]
MITGSDHSEDALDRERDRYHIRDAAERMKFADGLQRQMETNGRLISAGMIKPMLGVAMVAFLIAAMMGFVWHATGAFVFVTLIWGWRRMKKLRSLDRLQNEAVERQHGIDRRFGRMGAKGK